MPSTLSAIAVCMAETISVTVDVCEPVHWEVQPKNAQASSIPYWVGVKNGLVVTWLTKVNLYSLGGRAAANASRTDLLPKPPPSAAAAAAPPRPNFAAM